jgi:hypothetical protein
LTVEPETDGTPSEDPVDASSAVSAVSAALTTTGTDDESVVTIADSAPTAAFPVVDTTLVGHTRIADAGTVATSRARVGPTVNVIVVSVAAPVYVAERRPPTTAVPIALNEPPDVAMPSVVGVTENVTGTFTAEPETSVKPLTISPSVTVPTAATAIGDVLSGTVYPSGARTTTANRTDPELGALESSVYLPIDTVFAVASNV